TGCGGGNSVVPPPPPMQNVTLTFTNGTPATAAVQIGTGAFTAMSLSGNKLTFTVPDLNTKFSVAFVCPTIAVGNPPNLFVNNEFIVQATIQDGTALNADCANIPATGSLSGSVNSSLVPGASDVWVGGIGGFRTSVGTSGSPFNVSLPTGTNDVAAVAVDSSMNALAVRMLRSQTVPGTLNGGSTVILGPSDLTTLQPVTVSGLPAGFAAPTEFVDYHNANGTLIILYNGPATQYRAMPAAAVGAGDFYLYAASSTNILNHTSFVGSIQTTTTGGGPITHTLPQAWSYAGPSPAVLPT